ncbi:MAG: hypothetical protein JXB49_22155 [Bacteroidales bacterium]|nr:hypothetical protein [Bacteroidales bacterium]
MKIIQIIALVVVCFATCTFAQNDEGRLNDMARIALNTYIPENIEELPDALRSSLENKLSQISTRYGLGASELMPRFIISANVITQSKEYTSTTPPMLAITSDVTLYIGDGYEGKSFASTTITVKGVGANETKAYNAALKNIDPSNINIEKFVSDGKRKIITYYNTNCDFIIKHAKTLESQHQFDEAIYTLMGIPEVCFECYNKAMNAIGQIYQNKIDWECKSKLAAAKNIWNAGQNYDAAESAAEILSTINPESACFNDIETLSKQIAKQIREIDNREWDFKLKKEIDLESQRIKAYRDVGVAYGNNQPKNVEYKSLW